MVWTGTFRLVSIGRNILIHVFFVPVPVVWPGWARRAWCGEAVQVLAGRGMTDQHRPRHPWSPLSNQLSNDTQRCWYTLPDVSGRVIPGQVQYAAGLSAPLNSPDKEAIEGSASDVEACPLLARQESQGRYLTGTYGQPQMPPELGRGSQRVVTIRFPS